MLLGVLSDLQFRRRRFAIAVTGASLVFALSLAVAGLAASFDAEIDATQHAMDAGHWFVAPAASGPFTSFAPIAPAAVAALVAGTPTASPVLITRAPIGRDLIRKDAQIIGVAPGASGSPTDLTSGRAARRDGEAVVSDKLELAPSSTIRVASTDLTVVGTTPSTLLAGGPVVFTTLAQAQQILGAGSIITAVVSDTSPDHLPDGVREVTRSQVHEATLLPLQDAVGTITMMRSMLWLVAALIVGSILYLNAMERTRDVAVFKAIGVSTGSIVGSMMVQAAIIAIAAAVLADGLALLIGPLFPMKSVISVTSLLLMPVISVIIALVASIAGVRRAVSVSPAVAFGGP